MGTSIKDQNAGAGCGAVFCGIFFLVGCAVLVLMLAQIYFQWRTNTFFVEHECVVVDKRLGERASADGPLYRVEIQIRYSIGGCDYEIWTYDVGRHYGSGRARKEAILAEFEIGKTYPCWYDPDEPGTAALVLDFSWGLCLVLLIPLLFILVGGAGARDAWSRRGKSPELLAAPSGKRIGAAEHFPQVPDVTLPPGKTLAFRLPVGNPPGCAMIGILIFTVMWNGFTSIFVALAIFGVASGQPDWCLNCFIIPFVVIGLLCIVGAFRQLLITITYWPATVEISAHPLTPGATCRLHVAQRGPLRFADLRILVVCDEVARYSAGEDTRTDTKRIHEHEAARPATQGECQCSFDIPAGAMHSFTASHNEVQWKVSIHGGTGRWLSVDWEYPFVVRPLSSRRTSP